MALTGILFLGGVFSPPQQLTAAATDDDKRLGISCEVVSRSVPEAMSCGCGTCNTG